MSLRYDTRHHSPTTTHHPSLSGHRATSDADLVLDLTTGTAHVPTSLDPDHATEPAEPAGGSPAPAADRFDILGRTITLPKPSRPKLMALEIPTCSSSVGPPSAKSPFPFPQL